MVAKRRGETRVQAITYLLDVVDLKPSDVHPNDR